MKAKAFFTGQIALRAAACAVLIWVMLMAGLAGCTLPPQSSPSQPGEEVTAQATSVPTTSRPAASPTTPATAVAEANDVLTLTWWTPEFLSPSAPQPTDQILTQQLAEFERIHNGQVQVNPVLKARYGKGGLLDLLRTAQPVAPGILPDIVTLDVIELEQAVAVGLLQPLDGMLAEDVVTGLYAFARSAGEFQDRLVAVQYVADLEHVVYLTDAIQTPPQTWDDLLRSNAAPFLFALGAPPADSLTSRFKSQQNTVLSQYLSTGPTVDAASRQPALEEAPLLRLLGFYASAAQAGLLPPNALELDDTDTVWDIFAQGRVPMAQISARRYLAEREALTDAGFAAAPGWAGPAAPIADGWALAVVTADPVRQQAAGDLITWLLRPENAGALAAAAGWLPTSPAALETWDRTPYTEFIDTQLTAALSHPFGTTQSETMTRLQTAIVAVLTEGASPQDAVAAALAQSR